MPWPVCLTENCGSPQHDSLFKNSNCVLSCNMQAAAGLRLRHTGCTACPGAAYSCCPGSDACHRGHGRQLQQHTQPAWRGCVGTTFGSQQVPCMIVQESCHTAVAALSTATHLFMLSGPPVCCFSQVSSARACAGPQCTSDATVLLIGFKAVHSQAGRHSSFMV